MLPESRRNFDAPCNKIIKSKIKQINVLSLYQKCKVLQKIYINTLSHVKDENILLTLSAFCPSWIKSNSKGKFLLVSSASHMNVNSGNNQSTILTNSCK